MRLKFWGWKPSKNKNIEPHRHFNGSYQNKVYFRHRITHTWIPQWVKCLLIQINLNVLVSHMCTFYWLYFKNIFHGSRLQFPDRIRFKSFLNSLQIQCRSSHPEVFLGKLILTIQSKFTGENPCRSVTSINLQSNFIEIALRHDVSPVNWLHIFRTPFPKNTSGWLLLSIIPRNSHWNFWAHFSVYLF